MTAQTKIEGTLASSLAAAFAQIEGATKSANNPHFKSKYADLTSVIEAIKPALIAHGLFFTQRCEPADSGVTVETVIGHAGGEELSLGKLFVPANKLDAQGFGSALTYARRYALVTAFGVPVEDDDGNAASRSQTVRSEGLADHLRVKIIQLCEAVGDGQVQLVCQAYSVGNISDLSGKQAEAVICRLEEKLAEKAAAETAGKVKERA